MFVQELEGQDDIPIIPHSPEGNKHWCDKNEVEIVRMGKDLE